MADSKKVQLELSLREASILCKALQHHSPELDDELISIMLYAKIKRKIEENE